MLPLRCFLQSGVVGEMSDCEGCVGGFHREGVGLQGKQQGTVGGEGPACLWISRKAFWRAFLASATADAIRAS